MNIDEQIKYYEDMRVEKLNMRQHPNPLLNQFNYNMTTYSLEEIDKRLLMLRACKKENL